VSAYLEKRLVDEWILENYPDSIQWIRPRLGQVPTTEMARAYEVTLRFPDAIIITQDKVIILEAKMRNDVGAFAQLDLYEQLFRSTPRFKQYWSWPIEKLFLTVEVDRNVEQLAMSKSIRYEIFSPTWAIAKLNEWRRIP